MRMRTGDEGAAAIVGFAVAVAIYAIAFYAFLSFVDAPHGAERDAPVLRSRAEGGLDALLSGPGSTTNAQPWYKDADNITRIGLAVDGRASYLDKEKLLNLTKGGFDKDVANGHLDYEEARAALGLGDAYQFHLRTYPILSSLDDADGKPVRGLAVAYIGDFEQQGGGGQTSYIVQNSSSVVDQGDHVVVAVDITNNGTEATIFQVEFQLTLNDAIVSRTANTPLLAPGASFNVTMRLFKSSEWTWKNNDKNVTVNINDPSKSVGQFNLEVTPDMRAGASPSNHQWAIIAGEADQLFYKTDKKVTIHYGIHDGEGNKLNGKPVNVSIRNGTGAIVRAWEGNTGGSNKVQFDALGTAGRYNVTVRWTGNASFNATDRFEVTDAAVGDFTPGGSVTLIESAASAYERGLLEGLIEGFDNRTYDAGGHVYPDSKRALNNDLATNLTAGNIDVLVVGSEVDQTAMTSNAAKDAVKEFVKAGGLLVVLGSLEQQVTWLQPLFHATLTTSGDGIGVPDESHPILHTPEPLAWRTYPDNGRTWEFNSDKDASHFTHVIVRESGGRQKDVLAVSKPGHFGNGTIVLTGWTIFQLTDPQNDREARGVFYNFLMHALGYLFVDFGPSIPTYAEVASSSRMATAPHPVFPEEEVLVRLVLYVFR